ncbi:ABC transporter substrate-binding protein [Streptomyces sp. NPDC005808]|uniref:ABC transporter substrate-binding protein n=1 Tax=Streptomyces sp. NPDC005808 TaxID=3364734 RepID=UPI0036CD9356
MSSRHPNRPDDAASQDPKPARAWTRRTLFRGTTAAAGLATVGGAPAYAASTGTQVSDAEAAPAGVTLKVLVNTPHLATYNNVLAPRWEQQTGGKLVATAVPYDQLIATQIADAQSGTGEYDIFDYFYYGLGSLVEADALVDITSWIAQHKELNTRDYLPSVYDAYTLFQGRRYGLPFDGCQHLVYYNTELLDRYGLQPPTTWDEYDAAAKKITQGGGGEYYGAAVQGQPAALLLGCAFINRLVGYGGSLVSSSGKPTLTSDAALAAAEHLIDINQYALPTPLTTGFSTANNAYLNGQVAMIETWTGMAQRAADPALSKIAGKWGAVAIPLGGNNTTHRTPLNNGYGLGVSTASQHQAEALAFAAWATSSEEVLVQATAPNSAIDPNRTSVLYAPSYAAATPTAFDLIRAGLDADPAVAWPKDAAGPQNLQQLCDQLALAIAGEQTARTALRNAQAAWEW